MTWINGIFSLILQDEQKKLDAVWNSQSVYSAKRRDRTDIDELSWFNAELTTSKHLCLPPGVCRRCKPFDEETRIPTNQLFIM